MYPGDAAWVFASVPKDISAELRALPTPKRGFGSIKVIATIGATSWNTSVFPGSATSTYLLPIKKDVRKVENLLVGDNANIQLEISAEAMNS